MVDIEMLQERVVRARSYQLAGMAVSTDDIESMLAELRERRRWRRVIADAETRHAVMHPAGVCIGLHRDSLAAADSAEACGGTVVECKVVPVSELEATCQSA